MRYEKNLDQQTVGLTIAQIVRRMILPLWDPALEGFPTRFDRLKEEVPEFFGRGKFPEGSSGELLDEFLVSAWLAEKKMAQATMDGCTPEEHEFLQEECMFRYDERDRANALVLMLPGWLGNSHRGKHQSMLVEAASFDPANPNLIRFTPHSVFFWALHNYNQEIPEWAPPFFHLLLTIAWLLDNFMEAKIENWKEVMVAEVRSPEDGFWFRGDDLKVQAVTGAIQEELSEDKDIARTIKKHVSSAKKVILNKWLIEIPLKPGEIEAANRTLCGLARATIRAWASKENIFNVPVDSPKQAADFINTKSTRPPGLSKKQVEDCLNECWQ